MKYIAIDFETYPISKEAPVPKPVCLSFHDGKESGLLATYEEMRSLLAKILKPDNNYQIIAHNFKFEGTVISEYFPDLRLDMHKKLNNGSIICTKIYEQLLDNTRKKRRKRFSLADLVLAYFEEDISARNSSGSC